MKYIVYTYLLFALLCSPGCKIDKAEPVLEIETPDPPCIDLPPSPNDIWGYDYTFPKYGYRFVSFHPQKPDIVLFVRQSYTSVDICTYNLKSKELTVVFSTQGLGSGSVEWGSEDWIFFPRKDRHIWKIRASGEELTQVSPHPACFYPYTNTSLQKLVYYHLWDVPQFTGHLYICAENGELLDSIRGITYGIAWEHSEKIAMFSHLGPVGTTGTVEILDPLSKAREAVSTYDFNGDTETGICWLGEHKLWYSLQKGIYEVDTRTQTTRRLRKTCETRCYGDLSYSPKRRQVVAIKYTKKLIGENLVELIPRICLLDTNGKEIEVLEIPEPE